MNTIRLRTFIVATTLVCTIVGCSNTRAPVASQSKSDSRPTSVPNYLKIQHEQALTEAIKKEKAATSNSARASAMQQQAAALDSLGRSQEALVVIDQAMTLVDPSRQGAWIATKAEILYSLGDPQAALKTLDPEIARTREFAASKPPNERAAALGIFTDGFIAATFANIELQRWQEAVNDLADANALLEGPSFYAYRSLVYRYIMARANDTSIANAELDKQAQYYASHDQTQYGPLLRMWQGQDSVHDVAVVIGKMRGADQQEAFGEALFYGGAYAKFVRHNSNGGLAMLQQLNQLAPYGSIEWIHGKRVLQ
jgi:tetratricopeptide (TPR) repeat protein